MAKLVTPSTGRGKINRQEKGDPSLNPYGRPKNLLTIVFEEFEKEGKARISKAEVEKAFEYLLGLSGEDIMKIASDKKTPIILSITAKSIIKKGLDALNSVMDRAHGKAKETKIVTGSIDLTAPTSDIAKKYEPKGKNDV